MFNLKGEKAFTLAEVLVTLGIIGVVSAMTVPTLMQNYQRKSYVTQLHKVYNELTQALLMYQTDRNALNLKEAGLVSQAAVDNFITNYFKIVNSCEKLEPCFASSYKNMSGIPVTFTDKNSYVLASGAAIRPIYYNIGNVLLSIVVDTNGAKGPNIAGRDIIAMYVYTNGLIDDISKDSMAPLTEEQREDIFQSGCNASSVNDDGNSITGCFGKILNDNWEMNY